MRRLLALSLALSSIAASLPVSAATVVDKKIHDVQRKVPDAHLRLGAKKQELQGAQLKVGSLQSQLDETNHNISKVSASLDPSQRADRLHAPPSRLEPSPARCGRGDLAPP